MSHATGRATPTRTTTPSTRPTPIHTNMRSVLKTALLGLALAVPALAAAATAAAATPVAPAQDSNRDVVRLKSGASELGRIKSMDFSGLDIDPVRGETKRISWNDVAAGGVSFAAPEYMQVRDLLDQNKFDDALPLLESLKADTKLRAPIRQSVLYFLGVVQQRRGDADAALATYTELLKEFPKSRYLMEVGEALVAIHVAKKDYTGAARALDQMSSDALAVGADSSLSAGVNVLKGRLFEEQGKHAEARAAYGVAASAAGVPNSVQMQAELGQARCAIALNQKPEGESLFRKLIGKDGPNPVMAGAWNGLADLTLERGRTANSNKGDAEVILDALYMYLRGAVQYAPLPGESTLEYERALAGSATCFTYLSQLESVADRKRLYAERGAARINQLRKEFPTSIFLKGN